MTLWTDELVEQLKAGVNDKLAFAAIGRNLGCFEHLKDHGRNACIGKARRLGLSKKRPERRERSNADQKRAAHKLDEARQRSLDGALTPHEIHAPAVCTTEHKIHFMEADNHHCHFPIWTDDAAFADKFYCGTPTANVIEGRPYCAFHMRIASTPARAPAPPKYWPQAMRKAG